MKIISNNMYRRFSLAFPAVCFAMLFTLLLSGISLCQVIYVNLNAAGNNNGTSWTNAYTDLQSALSTASPGDSIWVAEGIYYTSSAADKTISFEIPDGVKVFGGFTGSETDFNQRDITKNVDTLSGRLSNSYHVVHFLNTDSTTVLDGFTITGGNAPAGEQDSANTVGGGIFVDGIGKTCNPTINNCIITGNHAYAGGGVMIHDQEGGISYPTFNQCNISYNTADSAGGGVLIRLARATLNNCRIDSNKCLEVGGGIADAGTGSTINHCNIDSNYASFAGGGILNADSYTRIINSTISNNNTDIFGGGILNTNIFSAGNFSGVLKNCVMNNNTAGYIGGGMVNLMGDVMNLDLFKIKNNQIINTTINNCKFINNSGVGIVNLVGPKSIFKPVFTKCEISGNTGGGMINLDGYGVCNPVLDSCTIKDNHAVLNEMGTQYIGYYGGGILNVNSEDSGSVAPVLNRCTISGNSAVNGGGICNVNSANQCSVAPVLTNCIISGNKADSSGGGIYNSEGQNSYSKFTLMNCTVTGNYAGLGSGGAIYENSLHDTAGVVIKNSIIWNNKAAGNADNQDASVFYENNAGNIVFSYSLIANSRNSNGKWAASLGTDDGNNIDIDPLFKSALDLSTVPSSSGDFHLRSGSPALGAGSPATDAGVPKIDIDGNPRPLPANDTKVDMGAYEENNNVTKIKEDALGRPKKFMLDQNYPNPFNPSTKIRYTIPYVGTHGNASIHIVVYDILGRKIATLVNKKQRPGNYEVTFDGSKLASGIYLYKITAANYTATKKMILMK